MNIESDGGFSAPPTQASAHIALPSDRQSRNDEIFAQLRAIKASFGPKPDNNQLVDTLIEVCIDYGLNQRWGIVKALARLECNPKHVHIRLKEGTGTSTVASRWRRHSDGTYTLLDPEREPEPAVSAGHLVAPPSRHAPSV